LHRFPQGNLFRGASQGELKAMKKGAHPALQWIRIISPHGRLVRVLAAKAFKLDRPSYVRDPGKQSETVGTLAKFRRRFEFAPKATPTPTPNAADQSTSPPS